MPLNSNRRHIDFSHCGSGVSGPDRFAYVPSMAFLSPVLPGVIVGASHYPAGRRYTHPSVFANVVQLIDAEIDAMLVMV